MLITATGFVLFLLLRESGEEFRFRLEVILHRPVKIEMVLGEIGEDRDIPFESARPVLRERVRGNFHGRGFASRVRDLREQLLKIERLRRGADRPAERARRFHSAPSRSIRSAVPAFRKCV